MIESIGIEVKLSFMSPKGLNKLNWPSKPDKLNLQRCDLLAKVDGPAPMSRSMRHYALTETDLESDNTRML